MVFEIKNPDLFKKSDDKDKDEGEDILVATNEELKLKGAVEDEVDPKNTVSFYDNEDLRLYNVFQDTPSIVTNYINKKNKNLDASLAYTDIKDKASKADLERFEALVDSQSPIAFVPSRAVGRIGEILEDKDAKRNAMVYPNLDVDAQKKDNTNYDLFYRKRPLDTVNMPWYKKRALTFTEGMTTGGLGLVELATIPIDYTFDTNYLSEVQKLTERVDIKSNAILDQFFSIAGQFAVPFGIANKLLSGMRAVRIAKTGKVVKPVFDKIGVNKISIGGKTITNNLSKVASRGTFYGALAGGTDFLVATDTNASFGDYLGVNLTKTKELDGLEGSDRAIAHLNNKLKFGLEGTVGLAAASTVLKPAIKVGTFIAGKTAGGVISLASGLTGPVRKTLGTELVVGGQTFGRLGGETIKRGQFDPRVKKKKKFSLDTPFKFNIQPGANFQNIKKSLNSFFNADQVIEGGRRFGFKSSMETIDNGLDAVAKFFRDRGFPAFEDWQAINKTKYSRKEMFAVFANKALSLLTSSQLLPRSVFNETRAAINKSQAAVNKAAVVFEDIEKTIDDLINKESYSKLTGGSTTSQFNDILDDLMRYWKGQDMWRSSLPKEIRPDVLKLKKLIEQYNGIIETVNKSDVGLPRLPDGTKVARDIKDFLSDNYTLFNDAKFYPSREAMKKLVAFIRRGLQEEELKKTSSGSLKKKYNGQLTPERKKQLSLEANSIANRIINHFKGDNQMSAKRGLEEVANILSEYGLIKPGMIFNSSDLKPFFNKIFGKVNDPKAVYLENLAKIAHSLETHKAHEAILRNGKGKWFFDSAEEMTAAFAARNVSVATPTQLNFSGNAFNLNSVLNGKYTTPDIAQGFKNQTLITDSLVDLPFYKLFLGTKASVEFSKTVLSQMTHMRNIAGNTFIALYNGHYGGNASLFDSFRQIARDLTGRANKSSKEMIDDLNDELRRNGIVNTNIHTRQFEMLVEKALDGSIQDSNQFFRFLTDNKFVKGATKLYASEDNFWKIYGYLYNKSILSNSLRSMDDVQRYSREVFGENFDIFAFGGQRKTLDEAIQELSKREIVDVYPNYDMVGRIFKELRLAPIVGNFVSFPAEISRNTIKSTLFDLRRIKSSNPFIREQGYKGLIGKATLIATVTGGARMAWEMAGMNEQQYDYLREFASPWDYNSELIMVGSPILGVDEKTGELKFNEKKLHYSFANSNYHVPQGFLFAPINALINAGLNQEAKDPGQVFWDAFIGTREEPGALKQFVEPFLTESIIGERFNDLFIRGGKTKTGRTVVSPLDDPETQFLKTFTHIFGAFEPGQINSFERIIASGEGRNISTAPLSLQHELLKLLTGLGITTIDIKKSFDFNAGEYGRDLNEARAEFFRVAGKNQKGAVLGIGGVAVTREDRTKAYLDYQLKKYKLDSDFAYTMEAGEALGLNIDMQEELMRPDGRPRSGLTNAQIDAALDDYFIPARELSDSEGSFADRFANEYGGNINDYFDFEAMGKIYDFFDQDIPLGHTPSTIRRYYNGDITTLPALRQSGDGSEDIMEEDTIFDDDIKKPNIKLEFGSGIGPQSSLQLPITQPQATAATPQVAPPVATGTAQGVTPTETALLSPTELAIRQRNRGTA